ncbi:MAG: MobA/MobL family protein [Xenococcaceae cyanobacterium MO_167.B27]|nr:MobA/MobL family protein [Xenococcaceae cyanobacterium MO_167.B27]
MRNLYELPSQAPDWVYNRDKLWNQVELGERRKDSQLSREINVALPVELSKSQQIELVKEFVQKQFVDLGMIADVAFHNLSSHNPHAHIMLTMREISKEGFSKKKQTAWNRRELLEKQREAWAEIANRALEKAQVNEKIDHRTLEAQNINRIPQIHLGANVNAMMKRGIATEKGDRWMAIAKANQELMETENQIDGYRTYARANFVLDNAGTPGRSGYRFFEGKTYTIEKLEETITIFRNDLPDPIFIATYRQDELSNLSVSSVNYYREFQNKLSNLVTLLKEQIQQKQQKQQVRRGGMSI